MLQTKQQKDNIDMGIFDWLFGKKREARNITNPSDNWDFKEGIKLLRKENVVWQSHNLEQVDVYTLDPHFRLGQAPPDYDIVKGYIGKNNNGKKTQWWECKNYIFKSFEDEKQQTTELNKLLNENNLDINESEINNDNKYWNGDDFRIFSPQPINNTKTIIISMLDDSVFEFINKLVDVKINIKTPSKEEKTKKTFINKLNEDQEKWLGLIDIRVNAIPFDFIERTYTVEALGEEHFSEYKMNESRIPKDERKEVALNRVNGLYSIKDYINKNGTKQQKFHYEASVKGAKLYASSLGLIV